MSRRGTSGFSGASASKREFLQTILGAGIAGISLAGTGVTTGEKRTTQEGGVATENDWPMFQHDAWNSGTLETTGPSEPVEAIWTFETEGELVSQPIVKDGTVFQSSKDSNIYAISVDSGTKEWSVGTNEPLVQTPAVSGNLVYVPTQTGRIIALSVGTGSGQWSTSLEFDLPSDVTLTSDSIIISDATESSYHVCSLNRATGDREWQYGIDGGPLNTPVIADNRIHVLRQAIGEDSSTEHMAVETRALSNRDVEWDSRIADHGMTLHRTTGISYSEYDGGTVFAGDNSNGGVVSLDATTGERNWKFTNLGMVGTFPTFADGTLYVTTHEPALYAIDPSIGSERWRVDLDGEPTSPVVTDGIVYLGTSSGSVYAFDAQSSEERWVFETEDSVVAPPVVLDGTVYAASTDGTLYALQEQGSMSPGDVTGDGEPAQDLDNDGLYEDINGDGAFTIVDVQALFANLDSDAVQNNVKKFDFNGDGKVDVTDVQALYDKLNK